MRVKSLFIEYFLKYRKYLFFVFALVIVGTILRSYRIGDYLTFLGDEGRDVLIVRRFLVNHDFFLIGPQTSVGNIYLGPFYYYLIAIPLLISGFNPVGPAIMVAIIGALTIFLVFEFGRVLFSPKAGVFAALLYTFSSAIIDQTRSSWNPYPMPFFTILLLYCLLLANRRRQYIFLGLAGLFLGITLQLHYMALALVPVVGVWFVFVLMAEREKKRGVIFGWLLGLVAFVAVMLPLAIFDLRHGFLNSKAFINFFTTSGGSFNAQSFLEKFKDIGRLLGELFFTSYDFSLVMIFIILLALFYIIWGLKVMKRTEFLLIFLWGVIGIGAVSFYKGPLYTHYLGFLFPLPFLILGLVMEAVSNIFHGLTPVALKPRKENVATASIHPLAKARGILEAFSRKKLGFVMVCVITLVFLYSNFSNYFFWKEPHYNLYRTKAVAKIIADSSGGEALNIAFVSPNREYRGMAYRYFLEAEYRKNILSWDNYSESLVLYVVTDGVNVTDPTKIDIWEIQSFRPDKVVGKWDTGFGTTIYKVSKKMR